MIIFSRVTNEPSAFAAVHALDRLLVIAWVVVLKEVLVMMWPVSDSGNVYDRLW